MGKEPDEAARALGSKGGKQRAKNLTPEQRREIALKGAEARWKKEMQKDKPNPHVLLSQIGQVQKEMSKKLRNFKKLSPEEQVKVAAFFGVSAKKGGKQ